MSAFWVLLGLAMSSTWMAAVGWYVGLVHYPAFLRVDPTQWGVFHQMHTAMTGVLVIGPMMAQLAFTAMLPILDPKPHGWVIIGSFALLALSFGWTMIVSGPVHGRIATAPDPEQIRFLIATNWPRALAWTLQAALAVFALAPTISR